MTIVLIILALVALPVFGLQFYAEWIESNN